MPRKGKKKKRKRFHIDKNHIKQESKKKILSHIFDLLKSFVVIVVGTSIAQRQTPTKMKFKIIRFIVAIMGLITGVALYYLLKIIFKI